MLTVEATCLFIFVDRARDKAVSTWMHRHSDTQRPVNLCISVSLCFDGYLFLWHYQRPVRPDTAKKTTNKG